MVVRVPPRSSSSICRRVGSDRAFQIASAHAAREEPDEAFRWLDRCLEIRDPGAPNISWSPFLWRLHDDPRWEPLLKRMGL